MPPASASPSSASAATSAGVSPAAPAGATRAQRIHFGVGFIGNNMMVIGLEHLIFPVFSLYLGLSPALIGMALVAPRIWDGLVDIGVARWSDRTRTRWGRRRPFIVLGALATGIAFGCIWMAPAGLSSTGMTVWLIASLILFWSTQACFYVPLEALGMTLATDYHQRTLLMAYRSFFAKIGQLASAWCFWLVESGWFGTAQPAAIRVGWLWAGLIVLFCAWPGLMLRERTIAETERPRTPWWPVLKALLRRPTFQCLAGFLVLASGSMSISNGLHFYANLHYVAAGDSELAARLFGAATSLNIVCGIIALPLTTWLARRRGKAFAAAVAVGLTALGALLSLVLFTPRLPWLSLGIAPFIGMGIVAVYQLYFSMLADAAEEMRLERGEANEALFAAGANGLAKLGQALALAAGGLVLGGIGIEGRDFVPTEQQITLLRWSRALLPAALATGAVLMLRRYPLTEDRLNRLRG